jgi:hypothetical protein
MSVHALLRAGMAAPQLLPAGPAQQPGLFAQQQPSDMTAWRHSILQPLQQPRQELTATRAVALASTVAAKMAALNKGGP